MYKQGEIVLIPIPFTNLDSTKKRPVLILSNSIYNKGTNDLIVVAITSNIRGLNYEVIIDQENMDQGQLKRISCIRSDKIYTLSKELIIKKFGKIKNDKLEEVRNNIEELIN
ncbi:type II toxin-antitoxin system PemK/MazF family toxin [Fuchsiella alkaliacetigena]|uniref:type II toxin-antitoxin system PemK/MazF family toxin n=1 Tax=Fuchsiella alkaliacetigena TaxID=957042 RepID=UPI00200A45E7|nr:type II toxin-antitoxin system PemK/MazF family toxin [Fuchsiella alkaliacetigena]MCK8825639.1 type II toxin-antitoxin system PemK/MazF family toxin [Fuchsiella alkaliacetigena]